MACARLLCSRVAYQGSGKSDVHPTVGAQDFGGHLRVAFDHSVRNLSPELHSALYRT